MKFIAQAGGRSRQAYMRKGTQLVLRTKSLLKRAASLCLGNDDAHMHIVFHEINPSGYLSTEWDRCDGVIAAAEGLDTCQACQGPDSFKARLSCWLK